MVTLAQITEKQREIGLLLCWLMHIDPHTVMAEDWTLVKKFGGPVWTYQEMQFDDKGRIERKKNGDIVTKERRILLPMDVYTEVLESL